MVIDHYRQLLVRAVNDLVSRKLIDLAPARRVGTSGHIFTEIAGESTMIAWYPAGSGIQVTVWWKYHPERNPRTGDPSVAQEEYDTLKPLGSHSRYRRFVGVCVTGQLERRNGLAWLEGRGFDGLTGVFTRAGERSALAALAQSPPKPIGYAATSGVWRVAQRAEQDASRR